MHPPGGINLIVILAVALLLLGPEKLPELARSLGRAMNEFKRTMRDVTESFDHNSDHGYHSSETRVRAGSETALSDPQPYSYETDSMHSYHSTPETGSGYGSAPEGSAGTNQSLLVG